MKKNLVLGILDNYTFHQVKKFVLSLNRTGFKGDLCLFLGAKTTPRTIRLLRKQGVMIQFFKTVDSLPEGNLAGKIFELRKPINYFNYRHYLYYDFLERNKEQYEYVLLTDVRDVYFQRDPFDFELGDGLFCALEGPTKKLKDCSFNGPWMKYVYGQEGMAKVGDKIISCAGTTWGKVTDVMAYLVKMLEEIRKVPDAKKAIDQALHNYMIYTGMLDNLKFLNNDDGVILTLSYEKNYTIDKEDKVRVLNGRVVNVLHQFDRMPDLKKLTDRLYLKGHLQNKFNHKFNKLGLLIYKQMVKYKIRKSNT
ncbi:MAG: hypothetical protein SGI83_00385 [Bacteroidota bacterium]|nr:hypothetical protein [Bacteroidota bacterium]